MSTLSIEEFGAQLLSTGDLDPVYLAITSANLPRSTLSKLCLSYWCFYHLGAAAKMAEAPNNRYWDLMMEAATYSPVKAAAGAQVWPRGAERRHYRGHQAWLSMVELRGRYGYQFNNPTQMIHHFIGVPAKGETRSYQSIAYAVQKHRGFGEWIAFKVADMAERVLGYDVDFSDCHLGIYKDPRQGAALVACEELFGVGGIAEPWIYPISDIQLREVVAKYTKRFQEVPALGLTRPVNVQEVETILCKYKSHRKGHYPLGKDTREIRHGLQGWGKLADKLAKGLPS